MKPRFLTHALALLGFFISHSIANAAPTTSEQPPAITECRWAHQAPIIDGSLDDPAWKNATPITAFRSHWLEGDRKQPPTKTVARLLWDRDHLYFSAEMDDTDVFATVTEQDSTIWLNDVFELFLKPAHDKPGYYEFEVNAANGKLDMFLPSRGAGGYPRFAKEQPFHLKSATKVRGTLNDWTDSDQGWTVEGAIPWRDFLPTGGRPRPGETWLHTLCRYDFSTGFATPALSSTAPLDRPDFHNHEKYIPLTFVGPATSAEAPQKPWTPGPLQGSPEPAPPFHTTKSFAHLETKFPIALIPEPHSASHLLLENDGYGPTRESRIARVPSLDTKDAETLITLKESIYDLCFHPNFASNGFIFVGANGRFGDGKMDFNNRLLRFHMDPATGKIDPASRTLFLEWHSHGHNGLALGFGKDRMLYVTTGDGTSDCDEWDTGQDLARLNAKLLRIDVDHPSNGLPYSIPADNPFLTVPGARPETWAYGFRNPWRMHIDPVTNDIWVGENGQDLWEYARVVRKGANYGWPLVEGNHDLQPLRKRGPHPIAKAMIEHSHKDFRSLTGGIVYRGKRFPELQGHYLYGDYSTGQIRAATWKEDTVTSDRLIARTRLGIAHFSESHDGEIHLVDYSGNAIHRLERTPPPTTPPTPFPTKLSETGLFTDTATLAPASGILPYLINAPSWHDDAHSEYLLALPNGTGIEFNQNSPWKLPDGSALVQTLSREKKRLETRILLKQDNEWSGYSYQWNNAQSDAELLPQEGVTTADWIFPSRQECSVCHSRQAGFTLTMNSMQLARPDRDGRPQLDKWESDGRFRFDQSVTHIAEWKSELAKDKPSDAVLKQRLARVSPSPLQRPAPKDGVLLPKPPVATKPLANPADTTASLDDRARSYLHANCAHCHVRSGGGNAHVQFGFGLPEKDAALESVPLHTTFGIHNARILAPGNPAASVLLLRSASRGQGQMPPIGTLRSDPAGTALLVDWIKQLKPSAPAN
jgi:glucose/arabinose dehydrogenase